MLVRVRDERCRPRPCELLSCSPRVEVASMALQPAAQELNPPVLAVVAMLAWRSPPLSGRWRHAWNASHAERLDNVCGRLQLLACRFQPH